MLVIRCLALTGAIIDTNKEKEPVGLFLKSYDPNAHQGRGFAEWTSDKSEAMQFERPEYAMRFWRQTSTVMPRRADGQPNRPLTAFTVIVEPLERIEGE